MPATADSLSTPHEVPFLNIIDPEFDYNSAELISAQQLNWYAESPIGLLVLRYAEAQELLRDRRLNHNGRRFLEMNGIVDGPAYDWFVPMIVNHDGPVHRRLRGLVNKVFTPRMIDNIRPFIRAKAAALAEELASVDVCEFVEDFGNPFPLAVMSHLLGVPAQDYDTFRVWTTDIGLVFSIALGGDIPARVETAVVGLSGYVTALMDEKRRRPTDDLISALVAVQQAEDRVSSDELCNLIVTLVFAAHDTTRHQFGNGMVAFSEHHDQWTLLARRPELAPQAVEEIIRWCPSAPTVYRFAAEDFEYRGLNLTEGTFLTMCVPAAQRDPLVFRNGNTFDIAVTREAGPLQFGGGPHHCLGAALARAELGEALPVLANRLGPPTLAGPVTWRPPIGIYGPDRLPLRFGA
jgi:hypothetical protein